MPEELAALGAGGWIGWALAVVAGGALAFRRIWRADQVSGANAKASLDGVQRLYELLDAERRDKAELQRLLKEANERVDKANKERNDLIIELGDIKAQLSLLKAEVRMLREEKGYDSKPT